MTYQPQKSAKPLGRKAYGSTPHLIGSRMGPGDHHCHQGQHDICTLRARDKRDKIIITEKLDGSSVAVANVGGRIIALNRAGYVATTSPFAQHHYFAWWVEAQKSKFLGFLEEGHVVNGEWLAQAHGTKYNLVGCPFVVFSISDGTERLPWEHIETTSCLYGIETVCVLSSDGPRSIDWARDRIATSGHGAIDPVEGAVWRVERDGKFDFLAKWVRPDKDDGKYLPEVSGKPEVWNMKAAQ